MIDLTSEEQENVRKVLHFLRVRAGGWAALGRALGFAEKTMQHMGSGRDVSASVAIRAARFARATVDDVLSGKYPAPGTCPHCGRPPLPGESVVSFSGGDTISE